MKRLLLFFIFSMPVFHPLFAQWNNGLLNNTNASISVGIYSNADFASNAVTTKFAYNFLAGNYLDSVLKNSVKPNLKKTNRIGYTLNYGIYAVLDHDTIKQKRVFNFFFALRHKSYFNASFTPDDFNLAFFGNASYAGKTANIGPLVINNLSYQQAEIGLVCTNFGGNAELGMGVSFLAGQKYMTFDAADASLYTDTYGQYLSLNSNTQAWFSDTSAGYLKRLNGQGASADIYFRAPYRFGKKLGTISLSVTDLGFIWWNRHSLNYQKDTSYIYNGITINSLSDLQTANFNSFSKDSLKNKYFPFTRQAFYAPIPTTLSILTNTALSKKFHLQMGYQYLFNANDIGYVYAQGDLYFGHSWITSLQAGYGGYVGGINTELLLSKQCKHSILYFAINHLQGIIAPAKFGGAGLYAEYAYLFGK